MEALSNASGTTTNARASTRRRSQGQVSRLLCLHGKKANQQITEVQLMHLGLTDSFEITHIKPPFTAESDDGAGFDLVYYRWDEEDANGKVTYESLLDSFRAILEHVAEQDQPYDAVYGFSQGAALATLLSREGFRNCVCQQLGIPIVAQPWKFVFAACAATGLWTALPPQLQENNSQRIALPSVHFIGMNDSFKVQSEEILANYESQKSLVLYLDTEHELGSNILNDRQLPEALYWYKTHVTGPVRSPSLLARALESAQSFSVRRTLETSDSPPTFKVQQDILRLATTTDKNESSNAGRLSVGTHGQYAVNHVHSSKDSSLLSMIQGAAAERVAICAQDCPPLTYGDLLRFIESDGDLRQIGVNQGDTIAYVAPAGVTSAIAFLAITSQCTSVPLDPNYGEEDYMLAFDQLRADFVVVFEGIDADAVQKAATAKHVKTVFASSLPGTCGLYKFQTKTPPAKSSEKLINPAPNDALVLRTSGTTSMPKVVPITMWSLVSNARAIAKNLGLTQEDVSVNVMPLFHIGGLSSNLLSSLASGGAAILMNGFDAESFVDSLSSPPGPFPRPTWYSAVPAIHSAVNGAAKLRKEKGNLVHSLRFIRTGADRMPHDLAADMEETFGCIIVQTYSMSEQMPISQPPTGFSIAQSKPSSVGQPLVTSMMIVDENLRPVAYGKDDAEPTVGEVCISGDMVLRGYSNNPEANAASFFWTAGLRWFRTGDVGYLDRDGFLFLTGRAKNLIKRGGEQINPLQVEDVLKTHPAVEDCIVFPIQDSVWGERVGVAVMLKESATNNDTKKGGVTEDEFLRVLRTHALKTSTLLSASLPEIVVFASMDDIPKTRTKKVIRNKVSAALGVTEMTLQQKAKKKEPVQTLPALDGLRFVLALAVNYVHIGNFDLERSADAWSSHAKGDSSWTTTRSWCVHTPLFFFLGGFMLAQGTMHQEVSGWERLKRFYSTRLLSLHPMYLLSLLWCVINWTIRCRPGNFVPEYEEGRAPEAGEHFVCQATPVEMSYGGTLASSIAVYATGLQAWPFAPYVSWFLSSYTWFMSVYYFCIFAFPFVHRSFVRRSKNSGVGGVWRLAAAWLAALYAYMAIFGAFFGISGGDDNSFRDHFGLAVYQFPLGWLPCFALGIAGQSLYAHYRPYEEPTSDRKAAASEKRGPISPRTWGSVADVITSIFLAVWICYGLLPVAPHGVPSQRLWHAFMSRILAPVGMVWFWGISSGRGVTAWLFSRPFVVKYLAPASYNMFLFHQPVSEVYFIATRGYWWSRPKAYFWFSPYPIPVAPWELPIVIALVIAVSVVMDRYVNGLLLRGIFRIQKLVSCQRRKNKVADGSGKPALDLEDGGAGMLVLVQSAVEELTGVDVEPSTGLVEAGVSSMMSAILVRYVNDKVAELGFGYRLAVADLARIDAVEDLADHLAGKLRSEVAEKAQNSGRESLRMSLQRAGMSNVSSWRLSSAAVSDNAKRAKNHDDDAGGATDNDSPSSSSDDGSLV